MKITTNQIGFNMNKGSLDITLVVVHDEMTSKDVDVPDISEKTFRPIMLDKHFTIHHITSTYWNRHHAKPPEGTGGERHRCHR
jgi:hypothetical protein